MVEKPFVRLNVSPSGKGTTLINLNNVQNITFEESGGTLRARVEYVSHEGTNTRFLIYKGATCPRPS